MLFLTGAQTGATILCVVFIETLIAEDKCSVNMLYLAIAAYTVAFLRSLIQ